MKKLLFSLSIFIVAGGILFAGDVSFKSTFVSMPKWQKKVMEKSGIFKATGIMASQGYYVEGIKKVVVSITVGKRIQKSPGNPVGYSFGYAGIIMKVIRKFGFVTMITFNKTKKAGTIVGFFPATKRQKYYGMLSFAFYNLSLQQAKQFAYKFNWRKIQQKMAQVQ